LYKKNGLLHKAVNYIGESRRFIVNRKRNTFIINTLLGDSVFTETQVAIKTTSQRFVFKKSMKRTEKKMPD